MTDQEKRYLQCMGQKSLSLSLLYVEWYYVLIVGALGRLEVELEHARSLWTEKEDETKELSILKENEVNNKTYVYHTHYETHYLYNETL